MVSIGYSNEDDHQPGLLSKRVPSSALLMQNFLAQTEGLDFSTGALIHKFTIQTQQLQNESENLEGHIKPMNCF